MGAGYLHPYEDEEPVEVRRRAARWRRLLRRVGTRLIAGAVAVTVIVALDRLPTPIPDVWFASW